MLIDNDYIIIFSKNSTLQSDDNRPVNRMCQVVMLLTFNRHRVMSSYFAHAYNIKISAPIQGAVIECHRISTLHGDGSILIK